MGPSRMLLTKPVIAAVSGHAVAGGLELALWCDLRVMEETATFGVFCRRWGVPLIDGGTVRLQRLIGQSRALDLILTGRPVGAGEAERIGLANRVVPHGRAREEAEALARLIAGFPPHCVRSDRSLVHEYGRATRASGAGPGVRAGHGDDRHGRVHGGRGPLRGRGRAPRAQTPDGGRARGPAPTPGRGLGVPSRRGPPTRDVSAALTGGSPARYTALEDAGALPEGRPAPDTVHHSDPKGETPAVAGDTYDRTTQDVGNIVALEHVNVKVPDQQIATLFYVVGLGLTRDPYLMTGLENMWINMGQQQFHLPTGDAQVCGATSVSSSRTSTSCRGGSPTSGRAWPGRCSTMPSRTSTSGWCRPGATCSGATRPAPRSAT